MAVSEGETARVLERILPWASLVMVIVDPSGVRIVSDGDPTLPGGGGGGSLLGSHRR